MRIICAPDKFRGSLTAVEAAQAMARGITRALPPAQVDLCPIADGGEGTVQAMLAATRGQTVVTEVTGPLGKTVPATWGIFRDATGVLTGVMEMAAASGLLLIDEAQRNPLRTSTFGTGQMIRAALDKGVQHLLLGIGGSATNDGGTGAAQALGVTFIDAMDKPITQPMSGGLLRDVRRIDLSTRDPRLALTKITVACDVTNPLCGPQGAAAIYGPQKGATPDMVKQLDDALQHLATLLRAQAGSQPEATPGSGAAGGLGYGALVFLGAKLQPGIEMVLEALRFDQRVAGCGLCLTGEGKMDGQSLAGKACLGVAQRAQRAGVKTVALVGALGPDIERTLAAGLDAYQVIGPGLPTEESMRRAAELLERATADMIKQRFVPA